MSVVPEEAALLRSIVANPDEDTPRLVYADWLDEHGRADRARLIRVQCQLEALRTEEEELLERHQREWGSELHANGANWWAFHRGFPEEIGISLSDFLDTHGALNAVTPLRRLHLSGGRDHELARLAALPVLAQARALEIDRASRQEDLAGSYGLAGVRALAGSEYLTGLQRLALHSHRVGIDGAQLVAGAPTFGSLTHLTLSSPALSRCAPEVLLPLVNSPILKNLVELRLGGDTHGRHALNVLRRSDESPRPSP